MSKRAKTTKQAKSNKRLWQGILAVLVVGAMVGGYMLMWHGSSSDSSGTDILNTNSSLPGRMALPATPRNPRPETLNPNTFADPEVRDAYQAAKDAPEVLEHLACYCGCFREANHRNNLDCFKDMHGTQCALCRAIAIEGRRERGQGIPIEQIKHNVDEKWAPEMAH
jgi:hypothetical protein